jgi:hypothetical protein
MIIAVWLGVRVQINTPVSQVSFPSPSVFNQSEKHDRLVGCLVAGSKADASDISTVRRSACAR